MNTEKLNDLKTIDADLPIEVTSVIWQKCFKEEICIKIPFDGKKCVGASGCVRILAEKDKYYLEVQLFGTKKKFRLTEKGACITGFTVGVATLKVCFSKVEIVDDRLKKIRIDVRLCIGALGLEKCWNVIGTDINFFYQNENASADSFGEFYAPLLQALDLAKAAGTDIVFVEGSDTDAIPKGNCDYTTTPLLEEGDYPWWR